MIKTLLSSIVLLIPLFGISQERIMYKEIDTVSLFMEIHRPEVLDDTQKHAAIVFFYGGGWNEGELSQFEQHAKYFSSKGMISFLVDYRVKNRHGTSPFEALKDAKSAMRFIRKNYQKFNIDTSKIVAAGGSAGGHLAAAIALVGDYNEASDDLSVSCIPNALVLFNPVIDNGPGGYGYERVGNHYKAFSPLHNIKAGAPPTIIFLGTKDKHIPAATMEYYQTVMQKIESRCDLHLYEGKEHGFFNSFKDEESYHDTVLKTEAFLKELGYIENL